MILLTHMEELYWMLWSHDFYSLFSIKSSFLFSTVLEYFIDRRGQNSFFFYAKRQITLCFLYIWYYTQFKNRELLKQDIKLFFMAITTHSKCHKLFCLRQFMSCRFACLTQQVFWLFPWSSSSPLGITIPLRFDCSVFVLVGWSGQVGWQSSGRAAHLCHLACTL